MPQYYKDWFKWEPIRPQGKLIKAQPSRFKDRGPKEKEFTFSKNVVISQLKGFGREKEKK